MLTKEKKQSKEVPPTSTFKKGFRKQEIKEESVTLRAEEPKVRYLKLQPFHRQSRASYRPKKVPELRLCGNRLEKAGFLPENYVSVTVMDGLLVILRLHHLKRDMVSVHTTQPNIVFFHQNPLQIKNLAVSLQRNKRLSFSSNARILRRKSERYFLSHWLNGCD